MVEKKSGTPKTGREAKSEEKTSKKSANRKKSILRLIIALILIITAGVLFIGAVAGWFDTKKATLSAEYICSENIEDGEETKDKKENEDGEEIENSDDDGENTPATCAGTLRDISADDYEDLIAEKKSFLLFVDQGGCITAATLKGFFTTYLKEHHLSAEKIMFADIKNTSASGVVKYYPSVVVISNGEVIAYLRADADEDSDAYNKEDAFVIWLEKYIEL